MSDSICTIDELKDFISLPKKEEKKPKKIVDDRAGWLDDFKDRASPAQKLSNLGTGVELPVSDELKEVTI